MIWKKLLASALFVCSAALATAQSTTSTIVGRVTDPSGAVIQGAQVRVTDVERNQSHSVTTNAQGEFRIDLLQAGSYTMQVSANGFRTLNETSITLYAGQEFTATETMQLGSSSDSVEVAAGEPIVNTSSSTIGTTVESFQITELPLVDRNPYTLLDTVPGVQSNANSIVLGYPEQRTKINGGIDAGTGSVNYYLDGANNMTGLRNTGNILPNPDALLEFRVQTSNYPADQGRFASGVISAITRSGTNDFHGDVFEFNRNTNMKAQDWGSGGLPNSPLQRNQFGGNFGGPLRRNSMFFFGSYAGLRQTSNQFLTSAVVPTTAERNGDFSADPMSMWPVDPTTKTTFVSCQGVQGKICGTALDPVSAKVVNAYIPAGTSSSTGSTDPTKFNQWSGYVPTINNADDFLAKMDATLNDRQHIFAEYFNTSGQSSTVSGTTTNIPWSTELFHWRQQNAIVSDSFSLSSNTVNQLWVSYTRNFAGRVNTPPVSLGDLGSTYTIQGPSALPVISVSGYFSLGESIAGPLAGTNYYSVRDLVLYTRGRHALRFGAEGALEKDIQRATQGNYGSFTFTNSITSGTVNKVKYSGNALGSFLLGSPSSISEASPTYGNTDSFNWALFLQDDYRIFPRLTLNLGIRWDVQTPPTDPENKETTYVPGAQSVIYPNAFPGQLFPGDPGVTRGIIPVRYQNVSPRLGFVFDPTGRGITSVRAGFGMYYGSVAGNEWNVVQNYQPFALSYSFPNAGTATGATLSNPYRTNSTSNIANPFPFTRGFVTGATAAGIDRNFQWPYTLQMNLSVQQQLTHAAGISFAYVGSLGRRMPFGDDVNAPLPSPTATSAAANVLSRRPNPNYGAVYDLGSTQTASYHALQVQSIIRLATRLNLNANYVWSKTIDSVDLGQTQAIAGAEDYLNLKLERGRAQTDLRHSFTAAIVWRPAVIAHNSLVRAALNNWQLSTITKIRSGTPFTILNGADSNLDGSSTYDRAHVSGDWRISNPTAAHSFNTAAFSQLAAVTGNPVDGNSARNLLTGLFYKDVDASLMRQIHVRPGMLQLRLDASNVLNIVSLSAPASTQRTVSSVTFGQITTANPMRVLQAGAKFIF